jgi:hypothetical protein
MNSLIRICGVALSVLSLSACGTLYTLDVYAVNDPEQDLDKTYVLLSANPELKIDSPEFISYASQVETVLADKGYERRYDDDLSAVALGIYLSANISDPSKKYHMVQTGIYENSSYSQDSPGNARNGSSTQRQNQNTATTPQQAPPEYLAGVEETGFATTVFTKHLNLIAFDLQKYLQDIATVGREDAVPAEIWSIDVETTGQPADLYEVFPVMVAAAEPYMTKRTDDVVRVKLDGASKRVSELKKN